MNDHPLGDIAGTNPHAEKASVVDTLLDLDDLLASDVRLAEKSARFYTRPDLEAKMEDLVAELETLVDSQGRPKTAVDASVADGVRSAHVVAQEVADLEMEYAKSAVTVRVRQMDEDDWSAFQASFKNVLSEMPPYPPEFYENLIVRSRARLVDDKTGREGKPFTVEQVRQLRTKFGHPAFNEIAQAAWAVNTSSGVSLPKSSLSSDVLRRTGRD